MGSGRLRIRACDNRNGVACEKALARFGLFIRLIGQTYQATISAGMLALKGDQSWDDMAD
jgi:hypothetical protein